MSQQQIENEEVIVVETSTGEEEAQPETTPGEDGTPEETPDSILPWGDPNKPPKESGKG
jgi:hypothetical protein